MPKALLASNSSAPTLVPAQVPTWSAVRQPVKVCFDVDRSGSICNKTCDPGSYGTSCCANYKSTQEFIICTINGVQKEINGTYGFVRFATSATTITTLTTASDVITKVNTEAYSGGWTNTADSFQDCQTVLGSDRNRILVLLTDGNPTACKRTNGCPSSCPSLLPNCTEGTTT